MIPCKVENYHSCLLVTFPDGKDLLLQSDYDQASFANHCGLIPNDSPSGQEWIDCDPTAITECPEEYYDQAVEDFKNAKKKD